MRTLKIQKGLKCKKNDRKKEYDKYKSKEKRKKELKKVTILFLQDFSPQIRFYLVLVWSPLSVSKRFLF